MEFFWRDLGLVVAEVVSPETITNSNVMNIKNIQPYIEQYFLILIFIYYGFLNNSEPLI